MDAKTLIIIAIILLINIVPIFLFNRKNKKKARKILLELLTFAQENDGVISEHDHWRNVLIGIDRSDNKKLFFIRQTSGVALKKVINLNGVLNCRVNITSRSVGEGKTLQNVVDKIELIFTFYEKNKSEIRLETYNSNYDNLTLTSELQVAEKWKGIVNLALDSKN